MSKRKVPIVAVLSLLTTIFFINGLNSSLETSVYSFESDKIRTSIRIALVADLHSCDYGEEAEELMSAIDAALPDVVVMVGDIIDDRLPTDHGEVFLEAVSTAYPCYYVSGNHEFWSDEIEGIKEMIHSYGVQVLEGDTEFIELKGQRFAVSGLDDVDVGDEIWLDQLKAVKGNGDEGTFQLLLSHRPELVKYYDDKTFDLVLSGHAHGGQWRLPGVINGLLAPGQGLFPKYAGGMYELESTTMIVSRGLARESTRVFRFYNRPELVLVDLQTN